MSLTRMRLALGVKPLSYNGGGDRGTPISRYYVSEFFREFEGDIQGHCLEFQEPWYCSYFGKDRVTKLDILHIDDTSPKATLVADLTKPNNIPDDLFDCIVCTQVLHVVFALSKIVAELHRMLKPGGVLLVSVPQVAVCATAWHDMWRFTPEGLHRTLSESFDDDNVTVRAYGNALTAAGYIKGLVVEDFRHAELDYHDDRFAVEVCARAVKRQSRNTAALGLATKQRPERSP